MAEYVLRMRLNKKDMPMLKKKLPQIVMEKIGPEMHDAIRSILVYKKLNPGNERDWASFRVANAGLFSEAILDDIDKRYLRLGKGTESKISVESYKNGIQLVIRAELTEDAIKEFQDLNPEAVFRMVTNFDKTKAGNIFKTAVEKAGLD